MAIDKTSTAYQIDQREIIRRELERAGKILREQKQREATEFEEDEDDNDPKVSNIASVVEVRGRDVFVAGGGSVIRVRAPRRAKIKAGDSVLMDAQSGKIVGKLETPLTIAGRVCVVKSVMDGISEIEQDGSNIVVNNGNMKPQKGDRVILDPSGSVIIQNLGMTSTAFSLDEIPNISWDDIGGLEEAKKQMIEAIELPHKQKELFAFYGKKPSKGVLLYGPPGCGKTLLAKAAANSLAKIYSGKAVQSAFIYIKGPEILDKYVGSSEASVRDLFARARTHKKEHGYPAIIFIDEAEALLTARGEGSSTLIGQTIVPMFLAEMDGLDDSGAMVILATNRPDTLDPAITRDGRIDRKIKITRPTEESATEIFKLNLKKVPLNKDLQIDDISKVAARAMFSPSRILRANPIEVRLSDALNGGMVAGVVDFALSLAIRRDVKASTPSGVTIEDILDAVDHVEIQNRDLNHKNIIEEMMGN